MYGDVPAKVAYKQTRQEIDALLIELKNKLESMDREQSLNDKNWGYVGNVVEVKRQLEELVRFT